MSGDELEVLLRLGGDNDGVLDAARDEVEDEVNLRSAGCEYSSTRYEE